MPNTNPPKRDVKTYGNAGVMGWPVSHSLSPKLHGYWLDQYNIDARYDLLPIEPENLENALSALLVNGFSGCNLTQPHKQAAMEHVTYLTDTAKAIGAVNTIIVNDKGQLTGDNTDAFGFIQSLNAQCPDWITSTKKVCIIGAGGAAKAIIYAIEQSGISDITVANRTLSKAQALAPQAIAFDDIQNILPETDLLINTTSLGMTGEPDLNINLYPLPDHAIVSDIVYSPRITPFLEQAKHRNLRTAEGIDMLLYQAVPAFEHWFGIRPEVTEDLKHMILNEVSK